MKNGSPWVVREASSELVSDDFSQQREQFAQRPWEQITKTKHNSQRKRKKGQNLGKII